MKVSVIVPVYNIEKYVARCILSLKNQTYKDIEVLIIDDGSTDDSKNIAEKLVVGDDRFVIISQKNRGVSAARNTGLKFASGDFVMFVDGDDWIDENCIEILLSNFPKDCQSVIFPYIREYKNHSHPVHFFDRETELTGIDLMLRLTGPVESINPQRLDNLSTPWGKLFRKEVIEGLEFIDIKIVGTCEDCLYNLCCAERIKKTKYIEGTFYHYNKVNMNSLTANYKKNYFTQRWNFYSYVNDFFVKTKKETIFYKALSNRICIEVFGLALNIVSSNLKIREKVSEMKKVLYDERYPEYFNNLDFSKLPFIWSFYYKNVSRKRIFTVLFLTQAANILRRFKK